MNFGITTAGPEAKPCPFCGMQPLVHEHTYNEDRIPVYQIFHCIAGTFWTKDFNQSLRVWNRRGDLHEEEESERELTV